MQMMAVWIAAQLQVKNGELGRLAVTHSLHYFTKKEFLVEIGKKRFRLINRRHSFKQANTLRAAKFVWRISP